MTVLYHLYRRARISPMESAFVAFWRRGLTLREAIQMIPSGRPGDIATIRSRRTVPPSKECGRRLSAVETDRGPSNEDHRALRPSDPGGIRRARGGLCQADWHGLRRRAVRDDRAWQDLPDARRHRRSARRPLPSVPAL